MEVSAKTGNNIKEFFKDLAMVIANGGKKKEEAPAKSAQQIPPQPKQNISLTSGGHKEEGKAKKKCEC